MQVVVPLAGPDFISPDGSIKGLITVNGKPIILQALQNRSWSPSVNHYTFILQDCLIARNFYSEFLLSHFPKSSAIYLSNLSQEASLSALAGISLIQHFGEPLVVDLADIIYSTNVDICRIFSDNPHCGAVALAFDSANPNYSYFECNEYGSVVHVSEKIVASPHASVGTYIFRNPSVYLRALAYALELQSSDFVFNNLYYVSLLFNGILMQKKEILMRIVSNVRDIKIAL